MQGVLTINGKDAYTSWGITLAEGSLAALMTPPPLKPYVSNKSRAEDGRSVLGMTGGESLQLHRPRVDERSLTLILNMTAASQEEFLSRYALFCEELRQGELIIQTKYQPSVSYRLIYESCQQFSQLALGVARLMLRLTEYNPTNRPPLG